MRRLFINEDNAHFYGWRPADEMTDAGCRQLVRTACRQGTLAGMLFNANVQRALYDSQVWEPLWHGYDPDGPEDQPALRWLPPQGRRLDGDLHGRRWVHHLWLLHHRGVDHLAVWLDECRQQGVEGWLTVRMNDCHHNDKADAFWHPTLWRERPDLYRAAYRPEGWMETAFDFGQPEVVEHHLRLIEELCQRYTGDGIEIDWNRWVMMFRPGFEAEGAPILTAIMRRVRQLAGNRKVGVRLPADPQAALGWGFDVITWAREGLIDQVVLAPFFNQPLFVWPLALWRTILGPQIRLLCQPEHRTRAYPRATVQDCDWKLHAGSAASALQAGADGTYLFNDCYQYTENPDHWQELLRTRGDVAALRDQPRRHAISYAQIAAPGHAHASPLPAPLAMPTGMYDFNRHQAGAPIALALDLGPRPSGPVRVRLGFDNPVAVEQLRVWLRGTALTHPQPDALIGASHAWSWSVPAAALCDGLNLVEVCAPPDQPGALVWAELATP